MAKNDSGELQVNDGVDDVTTPSTGNVENAGVLAGHVGAQPGTMDHNSSGTKMAGPPAGSESYDNS